LANEITNVECGDARVPDSVVHLEIFLETSKTSVGNIDTIKVAEDVRLVLVIPPLDVAGLTSSGT
jgi:hypothetical protein